MSSVFMIPGIALAVLIIFLYLLDADLKSYGIALLILAAGWALSNAPFFYAYFDDWLEKKEVLDGWESFFNAYVVPDEIFVYISAIFAPLIIDLVKGLTALRKDRIIHLIWFLFVITIAVFCFGISIYLFAKAKTDLESMDPERLQFMTTTLYLTALVSWYCSIVYSSIKTRISDGAEDIVKDLEAA